MPTKRRAIRLAATLLSCAALQLGGAAPAAAQADKEPAVPEKAGKELRALRLSGDAPHIDGLLDDAAWALADSIDDFVQWEPDNMEPLTERTVIRVVYDDRHLYVGVYCYDSEPSQIGSGFGRRDDPPPSDEIFIGFDPRHDHLTGYVFGTNPSGVFSDVKFFDDVSADSDYDAVWEVKTAVTEDGWTAEFRIPFSQMRFSVPDAAEARWGFDVRREIQRKGEQGQWVGRPRGERGQVSRWGHLIFTAELPSPHRMEALPYTAARREDLPGDAPSDHDVLVGADFRMGLGTAATLSATVNPDFAQVEQDPAVLNLTIFESFFPEKRPFFLEDARTFIPPYGLFRLFHSRRIGRRPGRYGLEEGDELVEWPVLTTIIGAGKVTGKSSGWTYGALSTLTAREYAVVDSIGVDSTGAETATRISRLIEPLTSYSAARIQRDIMGGSSNVGAIATAVIREGDADAATGGIDYKIRWDRNRFEWNGHWAVTRAPGPGGMATGFGGVSNFGWNGKHFEFNVHVDHLGRDFRVTDLGFLFTRIDRSNVNLGLGVKQPDPWGIFRSVSVRAGADRAWNGDGVVFDREVWLSTSGEFRNYWSWELVGWYEFETLDDRDTRGGPPIVSPAFPGGGWPVDRHRLAQELASVATSVRREIGGRELEYPRRPQPVREPVHAASGIPLRRLRVRRGRRTVDHQRRRGRGRRDRLRVRHVASGCPEHNGAFHPLAHPRPDRRALHATVRGRGGLLEHSKARRAKFLRIRARLAGLRPRLQLQVTTRQPGDPLGVPAWQHALRGLERLHVRRIERRRVRSAAGPQQGVQRGRHPRLHDQGELLAQPVTKIAA